MKNIKNALLLLLAFCLSQSYAQEQSKTANNWSLLTENQDVLIYKKYIKKLDPINDINAEYAIFKFVNLSDNRIDLNWSYKLAYNGIELEDNLENHAELQGRLTLQAKESYESSVDNPKDKDKIVFVRLLDFDNGKLTALKISSLQTVKTN